jgi:ABC-type multidrug transport system permease subunit
MPKGFQFSFHHNKNNYKINHNFLLFFLVFCLFFINKSKKRKKVQFIYLEQLHFCLL